MDQFIGIEATWLPEAAGAGLRVLIDAEPGFAQMKMENAVAEGQRLPQFDRYFTVGRNVATGRSTAPTAGKEWHHVCHPIVLDLFPVRPVPQGAPFTTVMSWQAHQPMEYGGRIYGQKDVEFRGFMKVPRLSDIPLEVAIASEEVPREQLVDCGWRLVDSHAVSVSFQSWVEYISASRGEFSVCKNVFVATNSGWFSERSACYLAAGRPVITQDTGFGNVLPTGEGLFAFSTMDEILAAFDAINTDCERHSRAARALAEAYFGAGTVLSRPLTDLGL
jgi:hypothetical protein